MDIENLTTATKNLTRMKSIITGLVLYLLICCNLKAQESVFIKRISETVTFNGIPDEPLWGGLNKFDLTMHTPTFGLSPSEISDVRMGYDNEFLWIGAKLSMKDASKIFSKYTGNAGLDVKYNINSNLTLDLTANTDFAQVEADDQQVNLTRYSLFFPEKRMFFQERSSLFDFSFCGQSDNQLTRHSFSKCKGIVHAEHKAVSLRAG